MGLRSKLNSIRMGISRSTAPILRSCRRTHDDTTDRQQWRCVKDKVLTAVLNADETQSETIQYYSSSGGITSSLTKETSADGLTVTRQWSNGAAETKEFTAEANGSYVWTQTQAGTSVSVAHAISLNGVNTWTSNEGGMVRTLAIDLAAKTYYVDAANWVYSAVLDRQMTPREVKLYRSISVVAY